MSWQERVKTGYTIKTGDGTTYTPKWLNPSFGRDYNVSMFEFPNVEGTVVRRYKAKGRKLTLELYFDGEDHVETAIAFDNSAKNSKAWTVTHPYYDTLIVQPISLFVDNRDYNVSKIIVQVVETVSTAQKNKKNAADKIRADKVTIDAIQANAYSFDVQPTTADVAAYKGDLTALYDEGTKTASHTLDSETYFNAFTAAYSAVDTYLVSEPLLAIRKIQAVINAPYLFAQSVQTRIGTLITQFNKPRERYRTIRNPNDKRRYEFNQGGILSTILLASVTNTNNSYKNRVDAVNVMDSIADTYNTYITDLDTLQTATGGDDDGYIPDFDSVNAIRDLVLFTIDNLLDIAIEGRQQRTMILGVDDNAINLVYELYGDDPDDAILAAFMETNNIGLSEMLGLSKGREIIYYVEAA